MTDTPVREPFDVEKLRKRGEECGTGQDVSLFDTGNLLLMAADEIERLRYRDYQIKCFREELVDMAEERNRLRTRLALAGKVIEAVRLEEECLASDDPAKYHAHNGLYKLVRDALAAYDAAKDGTEGAECDTKG